MADLRMTDLNISDVMELVVRRMIAGDNGPYEFVTERDTIAMAKDDHAILHVRNHCDDTLTVTRKAGAGGADLTVPVPAGDERFMALLGAVHADEKGVVHVDYEIADGFIHECATAAVFRLVDDHPEDDDVSDDAGTTETGTTETEEADHAE